MASANTGLPLSDALRRWSDPDELQEVDHLSQYDFAIIHTFANPREDHHVKMRDRYYRLRDALKQAFVERLRSGELIASGYTAPIGLKSRREDIPAQLWELLEPDFEKAEAQAPGLHVVRIEVREGGAAERPLIGYSPVAPGSVGDPNPAEFVHNADYTQVSVRGHAFVLTAGMAQIVRLLHEASATRHPWVNGKKLTEEAKYGSVYLGDVFKRHRDPDRRELIEGDGRGNFRLNLNWPPRRPSQ